MKAFLIIIWTPFLLSLQTKVAGVPAKSVATFHGQGLVFETPFQSFNPDPSVTEVEGIYTFKNVSDYPITIKNIKTSCGCTTARLGKKTYHPGETGEIKAYFDLGGRQGLQQKTIRVTTDDSNNPELILTLEVHIPEILIFSSRFVAWERGEPADPKTITLTAAESVEAINITEVICPDGAFELEFKVIEPGKQYQIKVMPVSVDDSRNALIEIKAGFPQSKPKAFYAHAFVK